MSCVYRFFENLGAGWINAATVLGAVIGIGLSVFAIWLSKKLSDEGSSISKAIRENTETIQEHTVAIQKHTDAIHKHTKILRLDNLRNLYELSRERDTHTYWHFRWRFETYDRLGVTVFRRNGKEWSDVGYCDLLIQNFSNAADHVGFEFRQSEFYTAKIAEIRPSAGQEFPFAEGDLVACFDQNGDPMVSRGIDPYTSHPKFKFVISGIGHMRSGSGDPTADVVRTFPRIKDS